MVEQRGVKRSSRKGSCYYNGLFTFWAFDDQAHTRHLSASQHTLCSLRNKSPALPGGLLISQVRNTACFKGLKADGCIRGGNFHPTRRKEAFVFAFFTWTHLISFLFRSCYGLLWSKHHTATSKIFSPSCLPPVSFCLHHPSPLSFTLLTIPSYTKLLSFIPPLLTFPNSGFPDTYSPLSPTIHRYLFLTCASLHPSLVPYPLLFSHASVLSDCWTSLYFLLLLLTFLNCLSFFFFLA